MNLFPHRLLILVGLTGVGKTTTVEALERSALSIRCLPDRREVTDQKIIAWLQDRDGEPRSTVSDRSRRFEFTRRYRQHFPGGMAHALASLAVEPLAAGSAWYLFDGLRGANEVEHAAELMPRAHFLVLMAPNAVRVARLLARADVFDSLETGSGAANSDVDELIELHARVLSDSEPSEIERLRQYGRAGDHQLEDLAQKLEIVAKEHQNYSAPDALKVLQTRAPLRTTSVRTDRMTPDEIVDALISDLDRTLVP